MGIIHALDVLHGGRGGSNLDKAGSSRYLGRGLAAKAARMPPKRREGAEQRRAREATHTVVWTTWAQIMKENVTYFEHSQKERFLVPNQDAPDATHSEIF